MQVADPDATDLAHLAARLRLVVTRLHRRQRQEAGTGLSPTAYAALATVSRQGRLTLGDLAELEGVRPPTITATVASLEGLGLVKRESDPSDRRIAWLALTPRGRQALDRGRTRKTAYLAERLQVLDSSQVRALDAATAALEALLEEPD